MQINDRTIFDNLGFSKEQIITIDKIEKIGRKKWKISGSLENWKRFKKQKDWKNIQSVKIEGLKEERILFLVRTLPAA